ncbi:MAG: aspartate--tRNA ligase [Anaerolineae bacterium]|nr:aspartate--tRNA ligase [Anaerolineae bacterium]MDQ7034551.1 aspartate--tRNA ligase [Anaerolineae bacterium]
MMKTHTCGELRESHIGQTVTLAGWVNRRRDQGGLIFIDLRDRWGLTQITVNQAETPEAHVNANSARNEFVLQVVGQVVERPGDTKNADLPTGQIEIIAQEINILNTSKTPPFYINDDERIVKEGLDESLRMKYRYLDLRRQKMQRNLMLRHRVIKFIRDYLDKQAFIEIETPILFKTTPEGARDFLVPSRLQPGKFYALPQSPQQLKQLLMVAGVEKYFQIARCFRDEDLRGQRQPEFTQLDLEMSFVEREDVMVLNEGMMIALAETIMPQKKILQKPFPRILYKDAMEQYGVDRPDIRYDLRAIDISDLAGRSGFRVFTDNVEAGKPVRAIRATGLAKGQSKTGLKNIAKEMENLARDAGAKGLAWLSIPEDEEGEVAGFIGKYFTVDQKLELIETLGAEGGDMLFFMSDSDEVVQAVTAAIRPVLAERLGLLDPNVLGYCWVIDFPMFIWDEEEKRWDPSQHMFTMPLPEDLHMLEDKPGETRGSQYDMVCNGHEVAGGSIRIHDREIQEKIFPLIGQTMEHAREQFGHMMEAFEYGAPPHGGIAWGLDRVAAILAGEPNIREVIAFPKTQTGSDVMAGAPSPAEDKQLDELHIAVRELEKET